MNAEVVRVESDTKYGTYQITVERAPWGAIISGSMFPAQASDLPQDVRDALLKWLMGKRQ